MAITFNKPIKEWYYEVSALFFSIIEHLRIFIQETSIWTLDYPIFFAYFEWFLSFLANMFDPSILVLSEEPFFTEKTLIFQRLSVIISESISLVPPILLICKSKSNCETNSIYLSFFFTIFNASLVIVDHIHFQYNGFLMGILLLSTYLTTSYPILSALVFTCLVFTKHFFVVLAPVWSIFLLNTCVRRSERKLSIFLIYSLKVLLAVLSVSAFAITPIIFNGQLNQFFSRLFPVSRSFIHFIPASNLYTLYSIADKVLAKFNLNFCKIYHLDPEGHYIKSMKCISPVKPIFCIAICLLFIIPVLIRLWHNLSNTKKPIKYILLASSITLLVTFQFGFHIHEKQILYAILPLGIYTILFHENDQQLLVHYTYLSNWSNLSVMVLLETYPENIIKYIIITAYYILQLLFLNINLRKCSLHNSSFIFGLTAIFFLEFFAQKLVFDRLQLVFIYHALSSLICAFPILYYTFYFYYYWIFC
ncbi:putative glycosyltransferases [Cryptosporidium sp. chipmunk genotype I]|uniref:putative glycosyltransferases n=1 Tax=Cryptosporidium sp. chipmunk genotype I TaxID=1280935 RepID=UPI00351A3373|nr:putative glycosyltransferases [Cryptosporidium sp. chipmunk genotype I]